MNTSKTEHNQYYDHESCMYAFRHGFGLTIKRIGGKRRQKFFKGKMSTYYDYGWMVDINNKLVRSFKTVEEALNYIDSALGYDPIVVED